MSPRKRPRTAALVFVVFFLLQLFWFFNPYIDNSYRAQERTAAFMAWKAAPTPENEERMKEELIRFKHHREEKRLLVALPLLIIDSFCIVLLARDPRR